MDGIKWGGIQFGISRCARKSCRWEMYRKYTHLVILHIPQKAYYLDLGIIALLVYLLVRTIYGD